MKKRWKRDPGRSWKSGQVGLRRLLVNHVTAAARSRCRTRWRGRHQALGCGAGRKATPPVSQLRRLPGVPAGRQKALFPSVGVQIAKAIYGTLGLLQFRDMAEEERHPGALKLHLCLENGLHGFIDGHGYRFGLLVNG